MKKFNKIFLVFTLSIVFSGFLTYIFPKTKLVIGENSLNISDSWQIVGSGIYIDDSNVNYDWQKTATDNEWCSGTGTWNDPYLIENVTIDGFQSGSGIFIENSNVFFIIRNCVLINNRGSGGNDVSGIRLNNVQNGRILNNDCSSNDIRGIWLIGSSNNTISNNTIINNVRTGIYVGFGSNNNTISDNILKFNDAILLSGWDIVAIFIFESHFNNFTENVINYSTSISSNPGIEITGHNNTFLGNKLINCSLYLRPGDLSDLSSHKITETNLVNGNPVYYYTTKQFMTKDNFTNAGQIILADCEYSEISDLNLSNGVYEISIFYSNNITIYNNSLITDRIFLYSSNDINITQNIIEDGRGIKLRESNYNNITSNQIYKCSDGIDLDDSLWNTMDENFLNENSIGIRISADAEENIVKSNIIKNSTNTGLFCNSYFAKGNLIFLNHFIDNAENAVDIGEFNYWDNGTIGNYWSDYLGLDANDDDIGDSPYYIPGDAGSIDNFPIILNLPPKIEIIVPYSNQTFYGEAPEFSLTVYDANLEEIWYTIDGGLNTISITEMNGTINQILWDSLPLGFVIIRFYANDTRGNISYKDVIVIKDNLQSAIPGY
ncbi:MAG: right-handed parallel beta-helix repeat-containing protein, partial [Promethearchaeota archaeon]